MRGEMRIRYGLAYGRENNFYTGVPGQKGYLAGTDGLFAQMNTAPDITLGSLFYTNNSGATVINSFTIQDPAAGKGNLAGLHEGKEIKIIFLDSNTTVSGSRIYLVGTDNAFSAGSFLDLIYHNSAFMEMGRSNIYQNFVPATLNTTTNGLVANWVNSFVVNATTAGNAVANIAGGMIGQRLLLVNGNSSGTFTVSTAGNIIYSLVGYGTFGVLTVAASGGSVELVKVSNGQWATLSR